MSNAANVMQSRIIISSIIILFSIDVIAKVEERFRSRLFTGELKLTKRKPQKVSNTFTY